MVEVEPTAHTPHSRAQADRAAGGSRRAVKQGAAMAASEGSSELAVEREVKVKCVAVRSECGGCDRRQRAAV